MERLFRNWKMSAPGTGSMVIPFPRLSSRVVIGYAISVFVIALIFGGGTRQGAAGDILVELLAIPVLVWNVSTLRVAALSREGKFAICIAGAVPILLLLQMIPLPPSVWSSLPGRSQFFLMYGAIGTATPWLPTSLDHVATLHSLMWTLPGVALFTTVMRLSASQREPFVWAMIVVGALTLFLNILQLMGGQESPLRFYEVTNPDRAVGLFANANHNAAFLYCLVPAGAALIVSKPGVAKRKPLFVLCLAVLILFMVFVGLSLTHSRAGVALGLISALLATVLVYTTVAPRLRERVLKLGMAAGALALLVSFQFGFAALSERVETQDVIQDLRWPVAEVTLKAAAEYSPIGSGVGTFQPIYEMTAPRRLAFPAFVNHAHDDWIELWLEAGVPGALIISAFLGWFLFRSFQVWVRADREWSVGGIVFERAGSIIILLLLLHSVVDYPLRTTAMMAVFSVACGFLVTRPQPS